MIAEIFYKSGLIEAWGRGTLKMISECKNYNLPAPLFSDTNSIVKVTFFLSHEKQRIKSKSSSEKSSEKILQQIKERPSITIKALAAALAISTRAVEKQLLTLKENGKIKRVGPDNGGHWEITS